VPLNTPWDDEFEHLLRPLLRLLPAGAPITADLDLVAAGLDSLNVVELLSSVEDHYAIQFAEHQYAQQTVATPGRLWAAISQHRTAAQAGH
jgi:acyl carrier protein